MAGHHPLFRAEETPEKTAYRFIDTNLDVAVSYATLASRALKGAWFLRKAGLSTGDGIVVLASNHPDLLCLYWAAQMCGLYYTAISVQFSAPEVAYILNNCDADLLVTSTTQANKTAGAPQRLTVMLEDWLDAIAGEPESLIEHPAEGAEMLYSSGTTGQPKGIRASRPGAALGEISELFQRRLELHDIQPDAVYLSTAPLYHSAPLRYNAMMLREGACSIIMGKFDAELSLDLLARYAVTHSQWVPTMFVRLLRLPDDVRLARSFPQHRVAIHAAAPCPVAIKEQMFAWWGPILYEYYSGTEGNGQTAISPDEWLTHKGSVGRSILGKLHITDDAANELEAGQTGAVYFSGGPRFEYYKDPAKTAAAFNTKGWSTLGDIGYVDEEGYLFLTDRASHTIITGGVNVYPREVEDVLLAHPAIHDAAVFGVPDVEFGESVRAAVELSPNRQVTESELIAFCRRQLAHLKCPKHIDFHPELPRHQTGKLYKEPLKAPFWRGSSTQPQR